MRKVSAWDVAPQDNIVVAALDVTSEDSVNNLVADIIKKEGNRIVIWSYSIRRYQSIDVMCDFI